MKIEIRIRRTERAIVLSVPEVSSHKRRQLKSRSSLESSQQESRQPEERTVALQEAPWEPANELR